MPSDAEAPEARYVVRQLEVAAARVRRFILVLNAVMTVIVIALLVVVTWGTLQTRRTAERVEDCTLVTGKCYQQLTKNGSQGLVRLINFFECALLIQPADRTPAKLDGCKATALTVPKGAAK